ncbi:hypothetical protein F2Q68_00031809 [Brassica cretica]|nr:hypothetical protein F2Q68_00031809 [Brassica cretica]
MPIVASLWTQKAKRWFDFLVFSASRTVFLHNPDAVVQLLRNCFSATLGLNVNDGGIGALLGHGGIFPVAPGILYLRMYRALRDTVSVTEEIFSLLIHSVKDIAQNRLSKEDLERLKTVKSGSRYGQSSLATAMTQVKLAASLSASLSDQEQGPSELVAELRKRACPCLLCGPMRRIRLGRGLEISCLKTPPRNHGKPLGVLSECLGWENISGMRDSNVAGLYYRFGESNGELFAMLGDREVLKSLSNGLRQWGKDELAILLISMGGIKTMDHATDFIIHLNAS